METRSSSSSSSSVDRPVASVFWRTRHDGSSSGAALCSSVSVQLQLCVELQIKHKFQHHHGVCLDLIRKMGEKIHNDHEDINPIPYELINNHRGAEPEKQIMFIIQALVEITVLFDDAVVPWDAKKLEDFLNVMHEEINGLHSCGAYKMKRNKKLHLYFERLRHMTELNTEDRDHSWEVVRRRVISFMNQLEFFSFHTHV